MGLSLGMDLTKYGIDPEHVKEYFGGTDLSDFEEEDYEDEVYEDDSLTEEEPETEEDEDEA
jgi:hypothetical protein